MHLGKLILLSIVTLPLAGCPPCWQNVCVRNEFEVDVAPTPTGGAPSGDAIVAASASGPCKLDLQRTGCDLASSCTAVAITGTGAGVCHVQGRATRSGPFSVDVPYESCDTGCNGTLFVTSHFNLVLGAAGDAGAF